MICLVSLQSVYVFLSEWNGQSWRPAATEKFHLHHSSGPPPVDLFTRSSSNSASTSTFCHLLPTSREGAADQNNVNLASSYLMCSFLNIDHCHQWEIAISITIGIHGHLASNSCAPWEKQCVHHLEVPFCPFDSKPWQLAKLVTWMGWSKLKLSGHI